MKRILATVLVVLFFASSILSDENSDEFDFLLALTRQDIELDWWNFVPSQFGPKLSVIGSVSKGEYFKIMPIFKCYGHDTDKTINITFDIVIQKPDGSEYDRATNCIGYKGGHTGPNLIPSTEILVVCFEQEDPFGEYTIKVSATDNVKGKTAQRTEKIELKPFALPELEKGESESLFFKYPSQPQPSKALADFLSHEGYTDEKGNPIWSAIWFYKNIFEDNEFLVPHTVNYFKERATKQQKRDIVLLFRLIDKADILPIEDKYLKQYREALKSLQIPDPYAEITTGNQLDMLWAEFFSTSHVKPARQIITALNLKENAGTIEKVKDGELDVESAEVSQKVMLEAVFMSAIWSIRSNCEQSPLFFHYCVGLYESDKLNKTEKALLGSILKKVSEDEEKAAKAIEDGKK